MDLINLIQEGRVDDFKSKFTTKFGEENINKIIDNIPHKYLGWVGKNLDTKDFDANLKNLSTAIDKFGKISTNLPITDLYQYKSIGELLNALSEYESKSRRKFKNIAGGNVVYEDKRFLVVNPLTHDASCYYGKGTKWCTAAQGDSHFKRYNEDGKLFYILDKTLPSSDPQYKVALLNKFDGDRSYWDAEDHTINGGWIFNTIILEAILNSINQYINAAYPEQVKLFSDKVAAKREKERLERIRQERILQEKRELAEERRVDNEWELGPDCPEVGLKAHALLKYLVDYENVEVITPEDKSNIDRLEAELQELNDRYYADEEANVSLLDDINNIEDELDELRGKIDVYNLIPERDYYDLTQFEVIDNNDLSGLEFVVGDEYEMDSSAYEYIKQLLDDVGYEGFNKSFVMGHIDEDEVVEYAREFYERDLYDDPSNYIDESKRNLSQEQEENIDILKTKILQINGLIGRLRNDDESEGVEDRISELEDEITDLEYEITEIESEPEGDFSEEDIEDALEGILSDVKRDPIYFMNEFGLDYKDFVNEREFIEAVVSADGYGQTLNHYDGSYDEVDILNKTYYIMVFR